MIRRLLALAGLLVLAGLAGHAYAQVATRAMSVVWGLTPSISMSVRDAPAQCPG